MRSNREAKKILKAYGKEVYKERIEYVDSFMPEKTSFMGSISYRHTFRRVITVALLVILIMALAVSAYAAVLHYLNYTKVAHEDNDEYVYNYSSENGYDTIVDFFEPTYIPDGYTLKDCFFDNEFSEKVWEYENNKKGNLIIQQMPSGMAFHIDNERLISKTIAIENLEVTIYESSDDMVSLLQYENTVIIIQGKLNDEDLINVVKGLKLPE